MMGGSFVPRGILTSELRSQNSPLPLFLVGVTKLA